MKTPENRTLEYIAFAALVMLIAAGLITLIDHHISSKLIERAKNLEQAINDWENSVGAGGNALSGGDGMGHDARLEEGAIDPATSI